MTGILLRKPKQTPPRWEPFEVAWAIFLLPFGATWAAEVETTHSATQTADATISAVRDRLRQLQSQIESEARPQLQQSPTPPPAQIAVHPSPKKKSGKLLRNRKREPASTTKGLSEIPVSHPSAVRESQTEKPIQESPQEVETRLTKNWGGARKTLSDHGLDLALVYKIEFNRVLSGGIARRAETLGNMDFRLSLNGEKMAGFKGTSAFFYILGDHGGHPSKNVGDAQGTSNIETPASGLKLYEAWVQQLLFEDKVSFLAGLHDLNSEFYATDSSGLFFNSSFGVGKEFSQSGKNGPSIFPTTSPALRLRVEPTKNFYLQIGAFNGQAGDPDRPQGTHIRWNSQDGLLTISEFGYLRGRTNPEQWPGKYSLGIWSYTEPFNHQIDAVTDSTGASVPTKSGSQGVYLLSDQGIGDSISVFFRLGYASASVNRFASNLSLGFVGTGWVPTRTNDRLGLGYSRVNNGAPYQAAQAATGTPTTESENTIELNYRAELLPGIALQPDLQYVIQPGTAPEIHNAWVGAVRLEFNL